MDGIAVPQVELGQQPEEKKSKKRLGLLLAVLFAVIAIGAFAYAFVWVGGVEQVKSLVGPYLGLTAPTAAPAAKAGTSKGNAQAQSPTKSSDLAAVALPAWALNTMYEEQLTSQVGITSMIDDKVAGFVFSAPVDAENGVQVPLKATFRDGRVHTGTIGLIKVEDAWYFAGLDTGVTKEVPETTALDESVVSVITKEQGLPASQKALRAFADGTITGMDPISVTNGTNTASLNVKLHGGAFEGKQGRFVCIKKAEGLDDYWFVTGFTWQ